MLKAFDNKKSKGRKIDVGKDEDLLVHNLDPFMADYLKILQSKACRRLASKTQVRCQPENPHVRTRRVHTDEVIAVAATISEELGLNTWLCMAIAAGHDMGHPPYGHAGESVLSELGGKKFNHAIFSAVVAQDIERKGLGLNLSFETLEGILSHSRGGGKLTTATSKPEEYAVVLFADKIAYTFSDVNDAIRYDYLQEGHIPKSIQILGYRQRMRNDRCIRALVKESNEEGHVSFSKSKQAEVFNEIRNFMYEKVYNVIDWDTHKGILRKIHRFFSEIPEYSSIDPVIMTALMTDTEATRFADEFIVRTRKPDLDYMKKNFGVFEILPHLKDRGVTYSHADLSWGKGR